MKNRIYRNQIDWKPLKDDLYCGWTSNTKLIKYIYVVEDIGASRSAINPEEKRYGTEFIVNQEEKDRIDDILQQFNAWEMNIPEIEIEEDIRQYLELNDFQKFYSYCFKHGLDWVEELKRLSEGQ